MVWRIWVSSYIGLVVSRNSAVIKQVCQQGLIPSIEQGLIKSFNIKKAVSVV
jgi:hypothetical protein